MSPKRSRNVMLRLTDEEFANLTARLDGEEVAVFSRRTLMAAIASQRPSELRHAASFIVAALSPEIDFAEALTLFDRTSIETEGA